MKVSQIVLLERINNSVETILFHCDGRDYTNHDVLIFCRNLRLELLRKSVYPCSRVAVHLERSVQSILSILGLYLLGYEFLPIDVSIPQSRFDMILSDSRPAAIVTSNLTVDFSGAVISVQGLLHGEIVPIDGTDLFTAVDAYLLYTSGSTGIPKGVRIPHIALDNFICEISKRVNLNSNDTIFASTRFTFDIFILETFVSLYTGAKFVLALEDQIKNPITLNMLGKKYSVNVMQATPAYLEMLLTHSAGTELLSRLAKVYVGGDALKKSLLTQLMNATTGKIYNLYGPTEATVWISCEEISNSNEINAGTALANNQFYIYLDGQIVELEEGREGELLLGGVNLSSGYLNRDLENHEKYLESTWGRLYRTGDLVRVVENGKIQVLGRLDRQIKINGYRIELEEVEMAIKNSPFVRDAIVVPRELEGTKVLFAFVTAQLGWEQSQAKQTLRTILPEYMVPKYLIMVDSFPLNLSNKVDVNALFSNWDASDGNQKVVSHDQKLSPEKILQKFVEEISNKAVVITNLDLDRPLDDFGFDSLIYLQFMVELENNLDLKFFEEDFDFDFTKSTNQYIELAQKNVV